jgi:hypothetical protein
MAIKAHGCDRGEIERGPARPCSAKFLGLAMKHDNGLKLAESFQQAEGARSDHDLPGPSAPLIPHEKEREAAFMLAWIVVICLAAAAIYRAGYVLGWW